jgi:hypothetical protein
MTDAICSNLRLIGGKRSMRVAMIAFSELGTLASSCRFMA